MRRLLLLRHAKSDWDDPGLSDHARPLNARGRAAAATMGGFIRDQGLSPDLVMLSSSRRTRQTLEGLDLPPPPLGVVPLDSLYLAEPGAIRALLAEAPEAAQTLMVIGHNPGLHELTWELAGPGEHPSLAAGFPTATLAEFAVSGPWRDLLRGEARFLRLTQPRSLTELAR